MKIILNHKLRRRFAPYLFLSPFLFFFAVFLAYPLIRSVMMAFTQCYGPKATVFVGFGNFKYLFTDPTFWRAVRNTVTFAIGIIVIQLPLALLLALILNSPKFPLRNVFRFAFFIPYLVGQVFVAVIFALLYTERYGLFNQMTDLLFGWGLDTRWLHNEYLVMPALIMTATWMSVGYLMIYFLAALQAVDPQLYEAAHVDGAGSVRRFLHVTIPGIKPVTIFISGHQHNRRI